MAFKEWDPPGMEQSHTIKNASSLNANGDELEEEKNSTE